MKIIYLRDLDDSADIHLQDLETDDQISTAFSKNARRAIRAHKYKKLMENDPTLRVKIHTACDDIKSFQDNFDLVWNEGDDKKEKFSLSPSVQ